MQKLWMENINWNDELPEELLHMWNKFKNDMTKLAKLQVHTITDSV